MKTFSPNLDKISENLIYLLSWDSRQTVSARNINEFIDLSKQIRADNTDLILDETSLISKVQETRRY